MRAEDLTVGDTFHTLSKLSLPLLVGNMLFSSYTIISIVWVGQLLGKDALGAVAIGAGIISIILALGNGASTGVTVLISNYYGAKKYEDVNRIVIHSVLLTAIIVVFMNIICIFNLDTILKLLNTPTEILPLTASYVKIYIISTIFVYFYLTLVAVLRGIGNVMIPMIFLGIATIINIILDPILILGIGPVPKLGLNGTAYASIISQGSVCIIAYIYVVRHCEYFSLKKENLKINFKTIMEVIKISFPTMLQRSIMSIGSMMVVSYVNALDVTAIAAFSAATNIDILITTPSNSISMAASSITGQCVGAGKTDKLKDVFKWGSILSIGIVSIVTVIALTFPKLILSIFTNDVSVQQTGAVYLRIVGIGYIAFAITAIASGVINGMGETFKPMIFTLVGLWVVRIPIAKVLSRGSLGFSGICIAILVSNIVVMFINTIYYLCKMSGYKYTIYNENIKKC